MVKKINTNDVRISHFSDLRMIQDHFPDGVDIERVYEIDFTEVIYHKAEGEKNNREIRTNVEMKELEPETGIYGGMSPVTHRVYIYLEENYQ